MEVVIAGFRIIDIAAIQQGVICAYGIGLAGKGMDIAPGIVGIGYDCCAAGTVNGRNVTLNICFVIIDIIII